MGIIELLFLALGLSADAFAASVCKGLASGKNVDGNAIKAGLWFGGFQALMPILGYLLGESFSKFVTGFDHWIIFGLLLIIGGKFEKGAKIAGGLALVGLGIKVLLEHTGII